MKAYLFSSNNVKMNHSVRLNSIEELVIMLKTILLSLSLLFVSTSVFADMFGAAEGGRKMPTIIDGGSEPAAGQGQTNHDGCENQNQACVCSYTNGAGQCKTGPQKSGLYCHCDGAQSNGTAPCDHAIIGPPCGY